MKKNKLISALFVIYSLTTSFAQQLVNGDFSQLSGAIGANNGVGFSQWYGSVLPQISYDLNGGTDVSAKISGYLQESVRSVCIETTKIPDDKGGSVTICTKYETVVTGPPFPVIGDMYQEVSTTAIPLKLEGKYQFTVSGTVNMLHAGIIVSGATGGYAFTDTLLLNDGGSGSFSLDIEPFAKIPCEGFGCTDFIKVSVTPCIDLNCYQAISSGASTTLLIDDLAFDGSNSIISGLDKKVAEISIYPNPASAVIYSEEFVGILDLLGNRVAEGKGEIQVSHLNKGIYLVQSEKGSIKIIKE
jgi:hypothetical protein